MWMLASMKFSGCTLNYHSPACDDIHGPGGKFTSSYVYESHYSWHPELWGYIVCNDAEKQPLIPILTGFFLNVPECPRRGTRIIKEIEQNVYSRCFAEQQHDILTNRAGAYLDERGNPLVFLRDDVEDLEHSGDQLVIPYSDYARLAECHPSAVYIRVGIPRQIQQLVRKTTDADTDIVAFRAIVSIIEDARGIGTESMETVLGLTSLAFCKDNGICVMKIDPGWMVIYLTPDPREEPLCLHDDSMCIICREDLSLPNKFAERLCCNHVYHMNCIDNWRKIRPSCPYCNTSI